MSLRLHLKNEVPPGGFRYTQAETGIRLEAPSFNDLLDVVKKHRKSNNIPIGLQFESELEDQLCQLMPPGICQREGGGEAGAFSFKLTLEQFKRGSSTLLDWWIMGGKKLVDDATIESRTRTCSGCYFNQKVQDCASCSLKFLHGLVEAVFGSKKLKGADHLDGCVICGCSNKLAVGIPLDIIQKHTPDDINAKLPDWCWKRRVTP